MEDKQDGTRPALHKPISNGFAFSFNEIRYEICGMVVDKVRNRGITSTSKGLTTFHPFLKALEYVGWKYP